jgi:hypothetical protein
MIARINPKAEKALRDAMGHVAHAEADQIESSLAVLDEIERAEAFGLAVMIAGYITIDACGAQWPTDASARKIAGDLATAGTTAKHLSLDAGQIYRYLSRVVLGTETIEDIAPDEPMFTRLPVIVAQRALVGYAPKGMSTWDYLDQIESAIEIAIALDATVLPAAVMRAYMPKPPRKAHDLL